MEAGSLAVMPFAYILTTSMLQAIDHMQRVWNSGTKNQPGQPLLICYFSNFSIPLMAAFPDADSPTDLK